jgi:hypothetical protein
VKKEACVIFSKQCDGNVVLGKVRDRMYDPSVCVYHLEVDGTEMCVMFDRITGFCEGINEHGIGIVNSSLMVLQDEREGMSDGDSEPERSPDGIKIVKALTKKTVPEALRTLIAYKPKRFQKGLKGHTLVSDGKRVYALENSRIHTPKAIRLDPGEVHTRTNHGIYYPGAGYTKGDDYISSIVRQWEAKKQLERVQRSEDLMPALTQSIEKTDGSMNPVRFTDKMRTTSQMVADPAKGEILLYLVPGHSKFEGIRNLLPDGRKPKMKVRVFKYPSKDKLKDPYVTVPDEMDSASARKSLRRQIMAQRVAARYQDQIPGGLADKRKPGDFDPEQLKKGIKVEMEHTDDPAKAEEIAMDHLTEDSKYYDKLETIEKHGKSRYKSKKKVKTKDGDEMTVYEYSDRQVADRNRKKAERIEKLRKSMKKLQTKVRKDVQSDNEKLRDVALAVGLMDETFERVGNPGSAKDGHFGVTTWRVKHVKFGKGGVTISYVGKSGVDQKKKITNARIVSALKKICKDKGKDDCVLSVTAGDVNKYLKPFGISAKDIRGFHANEEMKAQLKKVRKGKLPEDPKEREKKLKDEFKAALELAAERVGHEPSTLKSQYLVPGLEDDYMKDGTINESHTKKGAEVGTLRRAAEQGTPTERRILANALHAPTLIIQDRTWWLREAPTLYRMARGHERARPDIQGIKFPDHMFSMLWYEDADGNRVEDKEAPQYQHSRFPNHLQDSVLRLNDDGTSSVVFRGESGFDSDLVTAMVRGGDWDVSDAVMVAGQSCERCMNVLAHSYGLKYGYEFDSDDYWNAGTTCSMCEHIGPDRGKTGTKTHAEKEDEKVQKMLRKEPKKKPPRYDLRNNRTLEEDDPDLEGLGGGDKGDRDLSMKWNKVGDHMARRVAFRWAATPTKPRPVKLAYQYLMRRAETQAPGAAGGAQQQAPTFDQWVKDKRWPSKAENAPPGAEVGFEGLKKQDPTKAEQVRAEFKRQFPGAGDEGDKKDKGKAEEPKQRTREDIDADLESARTDRDELKDSISAMEDEITEMKRNVEKLEAKAKKPKLDPDARKQKIQERIDEEKKTMRESVSEMQSLGKEMDKHEDRMEDLDAEIRSQKKIIKDSKGILQQLPENHPQRGQVEEAIAEARQAIREARGKHKDEKKALSEKEKQYEELRGAGRQAAKAVQFLEGKLKEDVEDDDPKAELKDARRKLEETEDDLKEKREDLKAAEQRVNDLKAERKDPTGAKRQQDEAKKKERAKRVKEAITRATASMESMMGKGSGLSRETKAQIETQLNDLNEDEVEAFALQFDSELKKLTQGDPTSEDTIDLANAMGRSGFSTQGLSGPDDLGERLAQIAYVRNVVANPMLAGGTPVGQTEMDQAKYSERALDGFNQFQNLNSILRRQAASQIAAEMRRLDPESDKATELKAILAGINMAHIASTDPAEALPGQQQPSKGSAALIKQMAELGHAEMMLAPAEDTFGETGRAAMRQALNNMTDEEVAEFVVGEDSNHPYSKLLEIMKKPGTAGSEFKQLIKSFLIDDWMNDIWGDRAARDVMEAAGAEDWDDTNARAQLNLDGKSNGGPQREQAMEAMVRIDEARAQGKRPDPEDEALVQDVFGEGGRGLRESAKGLLDTLSEKFNKWVITPATAVLKNFVETGDKSVLETETVPHVDEGSPTPRTNEEREKARADAPEPAEGGSQYSPKQVQRARLRLKALRAKMKAQRAKMKPEQREKLDAQLERIEGRLSDLESGQTGDLGDLGEEPEDKDHGPGEVWKTDQGNWRAKNKKGVPKSFKDKDKAEQYAGRGKRQETGPEGEDEGFSADFSIPVEERGPTRFASDKIAARWLAHVRSFHPDDPNRPFVVFDL